MRQKIAESGRIRFVLVGGSVRALRFVTIPKSAVLQAIIEHLTAEVELYARAARAAHAEATDEQSRAENKYDTRGLEASYLARGQSRQAAEVEQALSQYQSLSLRELGPDHPIEIGALVQLSDGRENAWYFIGPRSGGMEVVVAGVEVTVITPQSPLGSQIFGRKQDELITLDLGGRQREHRVASVR